MSTSNAASSVRPSSIQSYSRPSAAANSSRRIWRRKSPAFFDDDAAATFEPGVLDREQEAQRVGVGGELARLDELDDHLLLEVGVGAHARAVGVGHAEVLQRGLRALHPRLARQDLLVDERREGVRASTSSGRGCPPTRSP